MALDMDARRTAWQAPKRPDWVSQVNYEGSLMDLDQLIPLDEASLVLSARERTGLKDFGEAPWYESFQIFVRALREEALLTTVGRMITRSDLINLLSARLEMHDVFKRHPEIDDEQITKPLMIIGQGRTGTSLLLNVLSQDRGNGSLKHWECMFPCPPPEKETYFTDPRIEIADALVEQWNRVNPDLVSCHEFNARVPTESSHAMTFNFTPGGFLGMLGQTPSHTAHFGQAAIQDGLIFQRQLLKLLQWKNPRKHWILKSPELIWCIPQLLEVYPDMNFIWTHRDPLRAVESVINMFANCMYVRSDSPFIGGSVDDMLDAAPAAAMLDRTIGWLESGVFPREKLCNVHFHELERDPVKEVQRIYQEFDMELTVEALNSMKDYMLANPRTVRPPAKYKTGIGEKIRVERQLFKTYQDYFGVVSEF